MNPAKTV